MKKLLEWCKNNIPFAFTLVLLAFIPLYPKLPLIDVRHTWVYVRIEDFIVLFVLLLWGVLLARKKVTLKTPLTMPILIFWIVGAIATIHGILLILPSTGEVYRNVAFLNFLRRMEYMSLFFISYSAMKDKRYLSPVVVVLAVTLLVVVLYGIGQKYLGFPAFLTMNEEFAKGIPIRLSALSRVSSTFSGHYDLAAYLVLVLPIIISIAFGMRNWLVRIILLAIAMLGLIVMFMTVSRISFFALIFSLGLLLLMQRKKLVIVSIPVIGVVTLLLVSISPGIFNRFGGTIKEIDVVVDATTGDAVGHAKEVPNTYFSDKTVKQQFSRDIANLYAYASPSAALIVQYARLEENAILLVEPNAPTGEDLPQGTGYINLSLSPVARKLERFFYEPKPRVATTSAEVFIINGNYLLKKVLAYDLSFTTRFQGEWPRAIAAFQKNILVGSGYGSVGLAVDNSYLRMLAEVGIVGFVSFLAIFLVIGIYIRKILVDVDSPFVKSFVIGFAAGVAGLALNALFIDVFEASKVAFLLWLLCGIVLGILRLYERTSPDLLRACKRVVTSPFAMSVYILIAAVLLYSPMVRNYFVGDDFTWFRWVADCGKEVVASDRCGPNASNIIRYFTQSEGFFYRPGAKVYFLLMYSIFWLNQTVYHIVSLVLHFLVAVLVFLLAKKIFKSSFISLAMGLMFLMLSGYSEAVHWISATGFLFTACLTLLSLHCYIAWEEKKKTMYFIATLVFFILSLLFHELGIVTPILILLYRGIFSETIHRRLFSDMHTKLLLLPIPLYLIVRYASQSHWLSGDYNYNLFRLPFNVVGNAIGYFLLTLFGPISLPLYQIVRNGLREQIPIALMVIVIAVLIVASTYKRYLHAVKKEEKKILLFGSGFFMISLLPFLGLGNISSRYSYLSSIGAMFVFVIVVKRLYAFLLGNGRAIATLSVTILVGVLSLLQIIQGQQIHADWYEAGEKSRRFIVAMEAAYEDYWAKEPMEFHLVNVPIRSGEAWVFPVGISDVLWLIFRNPNMKVFTWPTLSAAFDAVAYGSRSQKVFEFDGSGKVIEMKKPPDTQ